MKKLISEFIGTAILVILGCGTAMVVGCDSLKGCGYILTAMAFGLGLIAAAYSIGNISGCHINPAVSLAMYITGRMKLKEMCYYMVAQVLGAIFGIFLLSFIFAYGGVYDLTLNFGSNTFNLVGGDAMTALFVEIILTFIFVNTVLGVTSPKSNYGSIAGLIIGLTLIVIHIFGIGLTGTSVNPARSIAPAIFSKIFWNNGQGLRQLWVFILGPFVGAALAGFFNKYILESNKLK